MPAPVITLNHGTQRFAELLARIRRDRALVAAMWSDAESTPDELDVPGTRWSVALIEGGTPAAWCAARPQQGELKCHSNYEVPEHRGHGLYAAAYRARHQAVVLPSSLPAVTYLFAQPLGLHDADGWYRTGRCGDGDLAGHRWWELRRPAAGSGL